MNTLKNLTISDWMLKLEVVRKELLLDAASKTTIAEVIVL